VSRAGPVGGSLYALGAVVDDGVGVAAEPCYDWGWVDSHNKRYASESQKAEKNHARRAHGYLVLLFALDQQATVRKVATVGKRTSAAALCAVRSKRLRRLEGRKEKCRGSRCDCA
jgi:hypothetical protein